MKIRCITFGLHLDAGDFLNEAVFTAKFDAIRVVLDKILAEMFSLSHEVQTTRVSLNSFEEWLIPLTTKHNLTVLTIVRLLEEQLDRINIHFCSIGNCSSIEAMSMLPIILPLCKYIHASVLFKRKGDCDIAPDFDLCQQAAKVCLDIVDTCGELGNFRYCASFNCQSGTPFFPAAYHEGTQTSVSIGFENGDLLFLAFHGVSSHAQGRDNLTSILHQICMPIQTAVHRVCDENNILYGGIDTSINPGLTIPDSIGVGLENLIYPIEKTHFGSMGTLAAVATVTSAAKALADKKYDIKLIGYNGLMLPVMEDLRLAELAIGGGCNNLTNIPINNHTRTINAGPAYTMRDLLTFSSVCGVGIDTVPIPGNTTIDELAGLYMEIGAMAFRLNKPLSCRVLPMVGKVAGDMTEIVSPYLRNTRVFSLNM